MKPTIKQQRALSRAKSMVMVPLYRQRKEKDKTKYTRKGKNKWKI